MTPASYSVGSLPAFVVVGDFNGDNKPDLAVVNSSSANVSVLLGKGDGAFQVATNFGTGATPLSLAVGDFNGDGKPDLVVANHGCPECAPAISGNVSVLTGSGDGAFQAAVNYGTGTGPASVVVGDFNGDGKPDLAVANQFSDDVSFLLGNGDGTFRSAVNYATGLGPSAVAVGDFNGDGKPDLAVANAGIVTNFTYYTNGSVSVLLGNGDGTFQPGVNYGGGLSPFSLVVSDFNGDGRPDIAVTSHNGNVSVLLGNGDGTLQAPVNLAAGSEPSFVEVGDFNGDGKADLAIANAFSVGTVSVLLNTCVSTGIDLAVVASSSSVVISWPLPSVGFVLESTPSLTSPDWQAASETMITNNGRLEVTATLDPRERYFRLRKP